MKAGKKVITEGDLEARKSIFAKNMIGDGVMTVMGAG